MGGVRNYSIRYLTMFWVVINRVTETEIRNFMKNVDVTTVIWNEINGIKVMSNFYKTVVCKKVVLDWPKF